MAGYERNLRKSRVSAPRDRQRLVIDPPPAFVVPSDRGALNVGWIVTAFPILAKTPRVFYFHTR